VERVRETVRLGRHDVPSFICRAGKTVPGQTKNPSSADERFAHRDRACRCA
jgi:hypothetical protein